ncbi:MAG: hypothetical protein V4440_14390, partial [Pseudomonadota bacterium]
PEILSKGLEAAVQAMDAEIAKLAARAPNLELLDPADQTELERVENEILAVFGRDKLILPIDVRGGVNSEYHTIRDALKA